MRLFHPIKRIIEARPKAVSYEKLRREIILSDCRLLGRRRDHMEQKLTNNRAYIQLFGDLLLQYS
jgi:hypothetical protein